MTVSKKSLCFLMLIVIFFVPVDALCAGESGRDERSEGYLAIAAPFLTTSAGLHDLLDLRNAEGFATTLVDTDITGPTALEIRDFVRDCYNTWPVAPMPDIKANGSDGPLNVSQGSMVNVTVGLDPGDYAGVRADWWVWVTNSSWTFWRTFQGWQYSLSPLRAYSGRLFAINGLTVGSTSNLLPGSYEFGFGLDRFNTLFEETFVDRVEVTVY